MTIGMFVVIFQALKWVLVPLFFLVGVAAAYFLVSEYRGLSIFSKLVLPLVAAIGIGISAWTIVLSYRH